MGIGVLKDLFLTIYNQVRLPGTNYFDLAGRKNKERPSPVFKYLGDHNRTECCALSRHDDFLVANTVDNVPNPVGERTTGDGDADHNYCFSMHA